MGLATEPRAWLPKPLVLALTALALAALPIALTLPAKADRIPNKVAVFAALDKVTARISTLEIPIGETKDFGSLKVTPEACYTRSPIEPPKTTTFVKVDEVKLDGTQETIFSGWMFAQSPGLNAVQHPVFDVWLTDCTQPEVQAASQDTSQNDQSTQDSGGTGKKKKKRPARK